MIKKFRKIISGFALATIIATPFAPLATVHAQTPTTPTGGSSNISGNLCSGANLSFSKVDSTGDKSCETDDSKAGDKVDNIVKLVINIFSLVVGLVSVIMIIVGGLKYITSQGESSNTAAAKNTILYAIIGLVVVALAQIIVRFVLNKTTGKPADATTTVLRIT